MLTKKQLEDAADCANRGCDRCSAFDSGHSVCMTRIAGSALDLLKKLEVAKKLLAEYDACFYCVNNTGDNDICTKCITNDGEDNSGEYFVFDDKKLEGKECTC